MSRAAAQAAKRRKSLAQGASPGFDFTGKASREAAAALKPSAPLGLRRRRISNPSAYALGYSLAPLRGFGQHALTPLGYLLTPLRGVGKVHCQSFFERFCLSDARLFFASIRCSCAAAGMPVFMRSRRGVSARRIRSENRSIVSKRFSSWLRVRCETTRSTPSLLIRPPSFSLILRLCSSESVLA